MATLILAIIGLATIDVYTSSHAWAARGSGHQAAMLLAQEALERTAGLPYPEIAGWEEQRRIGSNLYTMTVSVDVDAPEENVKTITSVVAWLETPSVQSTVSLTTFRHHE